MNRDFFIVVIAAIAIVTVGFFLDFGHGLIWLGYTEPSDFILLMLRLLFLSLIAERIVEFYVSLYRSPNRKKIDLEVLNAMNDAAVLSVKTEELMRYKVETRQKTAVVGFAIGALMAIIGIRTFTGMFEFGDTSGIQIVMFDIFEVFVMGALMAGGSKGINKIVSAIESFAQMKPS